GARQSSPGNELCHGGGWDSPARRRRMVPKARRDQVGSRAISGRRPVINDLIAGHVKIAVLGSTPLLSHYKAATLRLLAQSSAARSPGLPDVPTFLEAGFNGLVLDQWIGAFAPAGTQKAIIVRLNVEINKVLTVPAVRENLEQQALEPVATSV